MASENDSVGIWTEVLYFGKAMVQGVAKDLMYLWSRYETAKEEGLSDLVIVNSSANKLPQSSLYGTDVIGGLGWLDEDVGNILSMDIRTAAAIVEALKEIADSTEVRVAITAKMFVDGQYIDLYAIRIVYYRQPSNYGGDVIEFRGIDADIRDRGIMMILDDPSAKDWSRNLDELLEDNSKI